MSLCWLTDGSGRYFNAKNLTSYTRIALRIKKTRTDGLVCVWDKQFSFGGDNLIIEQEFFVPRKLSLFTVNPIYTKIKTGWKFEDFQEDFGRDKTWVDYCEYIARQTKTVCALANVLEKSEVITNLINTWEKEGKL
jgi:hypothetical protein